MISFDSNILVYALVSSSPWHLQAIAFLSELSKREDVLVSELVLVEFYTLLRNPKVVRRPLSPKQAVGVVNTYRRHPHWRLVGCPENSLKLHNDLWNFASRPQSARRRIFDARLALSLLQEGVTDFATANTRDFDVFDFKRLWNPLTDSE